MVFRCDSEAIDRMKTFGLPAKQLARLTPYMTDHTLTEKDVDSITADLFPDPNKQMTNRRIFIEACAITGYRSRPDALDAQIKRTQSKKANLLLVLSHPEIELHNNSAELGARA